MMELDKFDIKVRPKESGFFNFSKLMMLVKLMLIILFFVGLYKGWNWLTTAPPKSKALTQQVVPKTDSIPDKYTKTQKRIQPGVIKGKYKDVVNEVLDSMEIRLRDHYKGKLPAKAIDAITLKDNIHVVEATRELVSAMVAYSIREVEFNFTVIDTMNTEQFENNEVYRLHILAHLMYIE